MIDAAKRASAKRITAVCPLLRLRPPGPQGRGPRADHRQAGGRHADRRRRRPDGVGRPALRPDPGLLRRPGRPPHRHAGAGRLPAGPGAATAIVVVAARRRPGEGGRALLANGSAPTWRSSTSTGPRARAGRGRGPRRDRRGRRPPLRPHRRHDRHRRHDLRRRRHAHGAGRHRRVGHGHPRRCCPTRPSTGSRTRLISRVVVTNTLPLPPEKQIDKIEVLSVAKHHRRRDRRRLRGHRRSARSSAARTKADPFRDLVTAMRLNVGRRTDATSPGSTCRIQEERSGPHSAPHPRARR